MLAERGLRVIRFDNRDIGHSTMIDSAGMPGRLDMMRGRRDHAPYLLTDMADDAFGLMDHLGIDAAHVVGASLGGMIAQTMAITHPERVSSLVSMMSTTGNRRVGWPHWRALPILFADYPRSREAYIKQVGRTFEVIGSPGLPSRPPAPRGSGGAPVGPLPQSRRRAAPDVRGHGFRRPDAGSAEARPADHRAPWHRRPAGPPGGRQGHRQGDPRRPIADVQGHGARPSAPALARVRRGVRRNGRPQHRRRAGLGVALDAAERSRTFTSFRPHGPEPCASTSSATAARSRQSTLSGLARMADPRRYRLGD